VTTEDGRVTVRIAVRYREASGTYELRFAGSGEITLWYDFTVIQDINPRQWGAVLYLPGEFDRLTWERKGQWTVYPGDHIGRLRGEARARPSTVGQEAGLRQVPTASWSHDANELGENDFRSTKTEVVHAALKDSGGAGLAVAPENPRAVRAFAADGRIGVLLAGFHTGGGEGFFNTHFAADRRPLRSGMALCDSLTLLLVTATSD
jgi:hypothetical protein